MGGSVNLTQVSLRPTCLLSILTLPALNKGINCPQAQGEATVGCFATSKKEQRGMWVVCSLWSSTSHWHNKESR